MSKSDLEQQQQPNTGDRAEPMAPGRGTLTSRLVPPSRQTIVFRVESAEAATALASQFGGRDNNGVAAGADVAVQRAAASSGSGLPSAVRSQFEASTGSDLSGVRVHTGAESAQAASAVGAQAYTTGQDIHFAEGKYAPSDPFGLHLLAHEVAHTVQQSRGTASGRQSKLEVSTPGDALEHEADRAADAMVAGHAASVAGGSGGDLGVQRTDDKDKKDDDGDNEKSKLSPSWGGAAKGLLLHGDVGMELGPNEALNKQIKAEYKTDPWEKHFDFPIPGVPGLYARFGAEAGGSLEGGVTPNVQVGQFTNSDGSKKRTLAGSASIGVEGKVYGMVKGGIAAGVPGLKVAGMVGGKVTGICSIAGAFGVDVTSTKAKGSKTWSSFEGHMTMKLPVEIGIKLTAEAFGEYEILWKTGKLGNIKLGEFPLCMLSGSADVVIPMNGGAPTVTNTIKYEGIGAKPEAKADITGTPEVKKDAAKAGVIQEASPEKEEAAGACLPEDAPPAGAPAPGGPPAASPGAPPAAAPAPDPNTCEPPPNHS